MQLRKSGRDLKQADVNSLAVMALLDTIQLGIMLFDEHSQVLLTNRSAQAVINSKNWLTLSQRKLKCTGKENADLQGRLSTVCDQKHECTDSLMVLNGHHKQDYILVGFTAVDTTDNRKWVICVLVDPRAEATLDISLLQSQYSLTNAEIDIASMIANGHDYSDIANRRNVEITTIRSYTKSIFRKMGVTSRAGVIYKMQTIMFPLSILKSNTCPL